MDERTDGHTDVQRETKIPRHYCVAGYKKLLERKKNGQIKGMISMRMMILCYTIQFVVHNVYSIISSSSSSDF